MVVRLPETYAGFIDAGFLHVEGSKKIHRPKNRIRLQAGEVAGWLRSLTSKAIDNGSFLRAYWYDGVFNPDHQRYGDQRRFFDAMPTYEAQS